ncbi:sulfatase [Bacteroidota bacterium]
MKLISRSAAIIYVLIIFAGCFQGEKIDISRPNIILMMADDLGWGDVGYNGNEIIITPNLDKLAETGIQFNRFYAAAPVCSPTRGSCLTGRHPYRYGIFSANVGNLKSQELSLAEVLKENRYTTGHFGKWHLGTLTTTEFDANRGRPGDSTHYSPPWENGFDVCFSTESKVPTWNPMITPEQDAGDIGNRIPGESFGTYYWTGPGEKVTNNLEGDDSRIIMDRVIPFIESSGENPFFAVIWFHTPHLPTLSGEKYQNMYSDYSEDIQHFYGAISAMDEQIGRLLEVLASLGKTNNTIIFFTSDNGPEGKTRQGRTQGSTNGLQGRKRSLYEGGIRVPGLMSWPAGIDTNQEIDIPVCTSDYFPTILEILGNEFLETIEPMDGINLIPVVKGTITNRSVPIGFQSGKQMALIDDRFKLYSNDEGQTYELYDLLKDPFESHNIIEDHEDIFKRLKIHLDEWIISCSKSNEGNDYSLP